MKYLAFDPENYVYQEFETIEEARQWLDETICDEGYGNDSENFKIYELIEKAEITVVAKKEDYTNEEWEEKGYSDDHDEIWRHTFIKQKLKT